MLHDSLPTSLMQGAGASPGWFSLYPFVILAVGLFLVVYGIGALKINAFLALISSAMVVSAMAPGPWDEKTARVARAFGDNVGNIGIVIAMAAIIGKTMMDSGAADRIVQMFLRLFGEDNCAPALAASGFTLAIPVFFDTVFYLLVPLARSMYRQTRRHYVLYLGAISTSAAAHALVPPTPGPLLVAEKFGISFTMMLTMGTIVAAPAALAGLIFAGWVDRRMPLEMRSVDGDSVSNPRGNPTNLPPLWAALAPIVLPIALITTGAVLTTISGTDSSPALARALPFAAMAGNPNFALLLAAIASVLTYAYQRRPSRIELAVSIEHALMSGGVIILITAAGGAFGAMLREAQLAPAIQNLFGDSAARGAALLWLAFFTTSLLKFAQGSTTTSMIVASSMFAAMIVPTQLGYHPVYLALAIGAGGLVGSWMNDSGFWIFAKMGGLTELETLKSWTPLLVVLGVTAMLMTALLAWIMPMPLPVSPIDLSIPTT